MKPGGTTARKTEADQLKAKLDKGERVLVIDLRSNEEEVEAGSIPGAVHIPMDQLETRMKSALRAATLVLGVLTLAGGRLAADEPASRYSLLESPQPLAAALSTRFATGVRVRSLRIQPASADVEAQDPALPANLDRHPFEDGAFGASEPVQAGRNRREREARLFPLAEVDLSLVPRLLADARRRAETQEAAVIQVVIERAESYGSSGLWGWPLMRFIVDGPRGGAVVEYDLKGTHKRTTRW